jgi:thiamine transport system permease protein
MACVLAVLAAGAVKILEERGNGNSPLALIIRFFAAAPIISSGIVLGLGWLILYGRNFSRAPLALVILHGVTALPFAFNFISEGFRSLPANTLNAASVFGAGPLRGLLTTALPLSLPRIRSAWGFAAALSMGELNAVMMLGMEGWETLPLYIYRAVGAYRYGTACAAGTLLILGCTAGFFLSETGRKKHGS